MIPVRTLYFLAVWFTALCVCLWAPRAARADERVELNISTDTVWTRSKSPYIVTRAITVAGPAGADSATLTIEPGVIVKFNSNTSLTIGTYSGGSGALVAQGTADAQILLTSNQASPAPGDWYNINFYTTTDDDLTVVEHCVVEYGGKSNGAIYLYQASPTFRNVEIENSATFGINAYSSQPVIEDCTFSGNLNYDLNYTGTVGGSVTGTTLNSGISLLATSLVTFSGNSIHQNNSLPIKTYPDHVGAIVSGSNITDADADSYLQVNSGTITKDAVWTADIPYALTGGITVKGTDSSGGTEGVTALTIAPGAVLKFNQGQFMTIGATYGDRGALIAQGTSSGPILFTSNLATPAPGNWQGIKFYTTADADQSVMSHCTVEYAGSGNQGAVYLNNVKPPIDHSKFRYSSHAGIHLYGNGCNDAQITCNIFSDNAYGIYVYNASPAIHENNFIANTNYGIYAAGSLTSHAENNWWGIDTGPNTGGDATYGSVDADPWMVSESQCNGAVDNHAPLAPSNPGPLDNDVRIDSAQGVALGWSCIDPNQGDILTYDLYWGDTAETLQLQAQDLSDAAFTGSGFAEGQTYYWQVVAKDIGGLSTAGPVWCFTTLGDPPDLVVTSLTTSPAGGLTANSWVTLTATIANQGAGPVVDGFDVDFTADGALIGTVSVDQILPAGSAIQIVRSWYYRGGDPTLTLFADSGTQVTETYENNNQPDYRLSGIADITPPAMVASVPAGGSEHATVQSITITLADTQSAIDDAAVSSSLSVTDPDQQSVEGSIGENNDTFTFTPTTLPLTDGLHQVTLTARDIYGNSRTIAFDFTIDTQAPAKPAITGGSVQSGTIQVQPALNTSDRLLIVLEGNRDDASDIWVNGLQKIQNGDGPWSIQLNLIPGLNTLEVVSRDMAGNQSESEWVDIEFVGQGGVLYEYDAAGRLRKIQAVQN